MLPFKFLASSVSLAVRRFLPGVKISRGLSLVPSRIRLGYQFETNFVGLVMNDNLHLHLDCEYVTCS